MTVKPVQNAVPINPGGTLATQFVVGRDELIERFWSILEHQSLALLAPRRVGKTSICRRMCASPPAGVRTVWRDLEGLHSGEEFVSRLYEDAREHLTSKGKALGATRKVLHALTGSVEHKGLKLNLAPADWSRVLDALFEDLQNAAERNDTVVVLFWDEFTWFLSDLIEKDRADHATTLLDRLRAARQQHDRIRMVLNGSIGLRTVLSALEATGYGNQPINDVSRQIVPLLAPDGAEELARRLLLNIKEADGDRGAIAKSLAAATEGHPLLLHSVAQKLKFAGSASQAGIERALEALLQEDSDPLELSYWARRVGLYLGEDGAAAVRDILDALAPHRDGLSVDQLRELLPELDRERMLGALELLRRDQYLQRDGRTLRFRLDFLRRYWCLERMLEEQ